jgi:subtilisin family serine protease
MSVKPAWSEQFEADTLMPVPQVPFPALITKEWAWGGSTGAGVRVAVIDSGVDARHPWVRSVEGGVAIEFDPDSTDGVRIVEGPHDDLFGHGTACAALIKRVAPDIALHSIRVLGPNLSGKGHVFAAGLRWAIDNGMQVVNMSLSTGKKEYFSMFHALADEAVFRNVMLVGAVNNVFAPSYPSLFSSVFSVAAHEGTDPLSFDYNPEPPVEFGAPGIDVEVAWANHGAVTATGNSFAAPCIAGLIALIVAKHPQVAPFDVKTILRAVATNTA